jgi:hypothetical protein
MSNLHKPPQKCQKTNHLTPVTIVSVNTQPGKSRFKKIRILLDSGSSRSIIFEKFICKLRMKKDTITWNTRGGGDFQTSKKCKNNIHSKWILWKNSRVGLHVDSTSGAHCYDIILGRDIMSELGITLNFKEQTMSQDDSMVRMKDPDTILD